MFHIQKVLKKTGLIKRTYASWIVVYICLLTFIWLLALFSYFMSEFVRIFCLKWPKVKWSGLSKKRTLLCNPSCQRLNLWLALGINGTSNQNASNSRLASQTCLSQTGSEFFQNLWKSYFVGLEHDLWQFMGSHLPSCYHTECASPLSSNFYNIRQRAQLSETE